MLLLKNHCRTFWWTPFLSSWSWVKLKLQKDIRQWIVCVYIYELCHVCHHKFNPGLPGYDVRGDGGRIMSRGIMSVYHHHTIGHRCQSPGGGWQFRCLDASPLLAIENVRMGFVWPPYFACFRNQPPHPLHNQCRKHPVVQWMQCSQFHSAVFYVKWRVK